MNPNPLDLTALEKTLSMMKLRWVSWGVSAWGPVRDEWRSAFLAPSLCNAEERRVHVEAIGLHGSPSLGDILERLGRDYYALDARAVAIGNWSASYARADGFIGLSPGVIDVGYTFEFAEFRKPGKATKAEDQR